MLSISTLRLLFLGQESADQWDVAEQKTEAAKRQAAIAQDRSAEARFMILLFPTDWKRLAYLVACSCIPSPLCAAYSISGL